jgi:quercetin dioxygenase-like cupin family protein
MAPRLVLVFILVINFLTALAAQTPAAPAGFTVTPVLENASVIAVRLKLAPGAREQPHTHAYAMLVVVLTAGEMEMHNGDAHTKGARHVGDVEFVNAGVSHHAANTGAAPLEALVLAIKPERVRGGTSTPAQASPGISRKTILDKPDVTVTQLEFEADVREPVHTHPYDLLVVATTPARLDVQLAGKKDVHGFAVGETIFIPRNTPHAVANAGTSSLRLLAVRLK